jgi:hypothetical protein
MMLLGFPIGIMLPLGEFSCPFGYFRLTFSPLASTTKIPKIGIITPNSSRHDPVSLQVISITRATLKSAGQVQRSGEVPTTLGTSSPTYPLSGSPGNTSDESTPVSGQNTTLSLLPPSPPVLLSLLSSSSSLYNFLPVVYLSTGGETA